MQSAFAKALLGACAAALLTAAPAAAQTEQPAAGTAGQADTRTGTDAAGQQPGAPAAEAEEKAAAGQAPSADTVVATAGGVPITLGELIIARRSLPAQYQQLPDEVLMEALVEQIADQILLAQAAREAGLEQERDVRIALENQARAVLANAYVQRAVEERVTDEAIRSAYEQQVAGGEPLEEAHAAHILVEDEETAEEIRAKLDEGADFAALAAEYGTDGTAQRGGDLGWFVHEQMVPEFADAVFEMEPGTVSEPVESPFGWHVIKLFETRERPVPPLDEVRDQLAQELSEQAQSDVLDRVRGDVEVERPAEAVPASAIRADELLSE